MESDPPRDGKDRTAPTDAAVEPAVFRAEAGSLYVVATPIGNLRDLTLRALDILRSVDVIAAEDTRVTSTLLARYGIATRPRAFHQHNEARQAEVMIAELAAGHSIALVADAGTPGISDPGARLVRDARAAGHRVVPIPGATALACAISAAGLAADQFAFIGFLPSRAKARRDRLAAIASWPVALVFYEAPHRIADTLGDLVQALDGQRTITVARELTKTFENIATMALDEALAWLAADANRARGEFVLIVDAPLEDAVSHPMDADRLLAALLEELPPARAARVAAALTDRPRGVLYARALELQGRSSR
jgi:16S rRNA (cytidine1402-2'-O)-methyltransferase